MTSLDYWYFYSSNFNTLMSNMDVGNIKKAVNYLTSPYDFKKMKDLDLTKWLGTYDNSTFISEISLPGSYNSMSGYASEIYTDYKALQYFLQTVNHVNSNYTLENQLQAGVRAFDFRVFHFETTENDYNKQREYYYCDKNTNKCYDFRFVSGVFPVSNLRFREVMAILLKFLDTDDSKMEYLFIRLTCEPWIHCEKDPIMGNLIVGFFSKFVGTN